MQRVTKRKPTRAFWDSVQGVVIMNSLIRDQGWLTAGFVTQSGDREIIKAKRETLVEKIVAAAGSGETVILQGRRTVTGAPSTDYLRVLIEGPVELNGVISDVWHRKDPVWPKVFFQMNDERVSRTGTMYRIRTPVSVFGPKAEALADISAGMRVHLLGRLGLDGYMPISPVKLSAPPNWLERAMQVRQGGSLAYADPW